MYEIEICPVKRLYLYAEEGDMSNVAAILVSSYEINQEKLKGIGHTLCLNFADVTSAMDHAAFSPNTAAKIANFVKALPAQTDTLFVCCDSAESRSTAMAAAIMRFHGIGESKIWQNPYYHPNTFVYRLLCEALGVPVSNVELQAKQRMNEKAFSDAIKQARKGIK